MGLEAWEEEEKLDTTNPETLQERAQSSRSANKAEWEELCSLRVWITRTQQEKSWSKVVKRSFWLSSEDMTATIWREEKRWTKRSPIDTLLRTLFGQVLNIIYR